MQLYSSIHYSCQTRIALFALAITLWANFSYAEHQVDYDLSHHKHHQCELFTTAANGLASSITILPVISQQTTQYLPFQNHLYSIGTVAKKARSPPC